MTDVELLSAFGASNQVRALINPQRLVTIEMESFAKLDTNCVQDHLREELREGWRIASVSGFGTAKDGGWLVVVLEHA